MTMRKNQKMLFSLTTASILILSCLAVLTSAESNVSSAVHRPPMLGQRPSDQSQLLLLPVRGNVYPLGYFQVTVPVGVGQSRKNYVLDPDTGSDLTWMPCSLPGHPPPTVVPGQQIYVPKLEQVVRSNEGICASLGNLRSRQCEYPWECCYQISYMDGSSSRGVLVRNTLKIGSLVSEKLVIGCGYDQQQGTAGTVPLESLLAIGRGQVGIPAQLHRRYGIGNATGHCLSTNSNGKSFVFFGQHRELFNLRCLTWTNMSPHVERYLLENARLYYDRNHLEPRGLLVVFDMGSTYTYLMTPAFRNVLQEVARGLQGEFVRAPDDTTLPHCWKLNGRRQVGDIIAYARMLLKPISFRFSDGKFYTIPPESYLIQSNRRNLCLGLLEGTSQNFNIIGDISLQGKLLIFDNERNRIGWGSVSCDWSRPSTQAAVCANTGNTMVNRS